MKYPKIIYKPETYIGDPSYTKFKFHGFIYKGCAEYIYWWKNIENKWKCIKIYLEKGNNIYNQYQEHLKGKETFYKFKDYD